MKKITQRFLLTLAMCVGVCVSAFAQASLPFNFDGKYADIAKTEGLVATNIDSKDYGSQPYLKLNKKGS